MNYKELAITMATTIVAVTVSLVIYDKFVKPSITKVA